jgi:hypothetical protein
MKAQVFNRNISPAITEQLCKTVATHEERAKSLKDLIRAAMANPSPYLPESPMTAAERAAFNWGFVEGMNVVLEYIKSGQPAPR